jgi:hypothetical protein
MSNLFPAGPYWGKVTRQSFGQNEKNNTVFTLTLELMGRTVRDANGEDTLEVVGYAERTVYMYLTAKTIGFVTEKLRAIGYTRNSLRFLDPATDGYHNFEGAEVPLWCKHDSYDGKLREKWDISTGGAGVKLDPVDAKALRGLDVLFGKAAKALPATTKPTTEAKQPTPTPEPPTDDPNGTLQEAAVDEGDDVPF